MATEYLETYPLHSLTNLFPFFAIMPPRTAQALGGWPPLSVHLPKEKLMKNALCPCILRLDGRGHPAPRCPPPAEKKVEGC